MKGPEWLRPNIFTKMITAFFVVLVPIYGISLFAIHSAEQNVHEELSQSVVTNVHFFMNSFENEMQRISRLNKELIFDDDFQKIRTIADKMDDYSRAQTILSVKNKLGILKTSSLYVDNVKVYIPSMDRGIFSNSYDNSIPADELNALLTSARSGSSLTFWNNKLLISDVYPDPFEKLRPSIALGVDLSTPQLLDLFRQVASGDESSAAFIHFGQNWSFSDGKNDVILPDLRNFLSDPVRQNQASGQGVLSYAGQKYLVTYEYSKMLDTYFTVYMPEKQLLGPLEKYRKLLWLLSLLSSIVIITFSYWIFRLIHQPLKRLVISFRQVERGNLQIELHHHYSDEFKYLYGQFNAMVAKLNRLIREVYEERIHAQQAELKQMQSQINPHFLYNSFFILKGFVRMQDFHTADRLIQHLGEYFRFITRTGAELVSLEQEISHSKAYTEIQMLRFYNLIEVEWGDLPNPLRQMQVPRLILQPIIENAFVHGLEDKMNSGKLKVQFEPRQHVLLITVEDNGEKLTEERLSELRMKLHAPGWSVETTGLYNVHRRLQLRHGDEGGLSVSRGTEGGLLVEMRLPFKEESGYVQAIDR